MPAESFNKIVDEAGNEGFGVAYSNQAFEYWLLLHFEDHQAGPMPRKDYAPKLNAYLKQYRVSYDANRKNLPDPLMKILMEKDAERLQAAIKRAKNGIQHHAAVSWALAESSTRVCELLEALLRQVDEKYRPAWHGAAP